MTTDFGMYEYLALTSLVPAQQVCVDSYCKSAFNWLLLPYWTHGASVTVASQLKAAGKKLILETDFYEGDIGTHKYTWTDIYNSLRGDKKIYNEAMTSITTQINENGASNLYAVTIGEENPMWGYHYDASLVNVTYFIVVHNQMYADLKAKFPTLRVFLNAHIAAFTDVQMATLKRDGVIDDMYDSNTATLTAWFNRMLALGGSEAYCIVHACGGLDVSGSGNTWYKDITPSVVKSQAVLAQSLGVPHLGWYAYATAGLKSILFQTWPACTDKNDAFCAGNYKDAILNIITPAPAPAPTPVPTPTPPAPTPTPPTYSKVIITGTGMTVELTQ